MDFITQLFLSGTKKNLRNDNKNKLTLPETW
jgi:hypothetical protein